MHKIALFIDKKGKVLKSEDGFHWSLIRKLSKMPEMDVKLNEIEDYGTLENYVIKRKEWVWGDINYKGDANFIKPENPTQEQLDAINQVINEGNYTDISDIIAKLNEEKRNNSR